MQTTATDSHIVYWIRRSSHWDIKSQGYVGVSKEPEKRFAKHWTDANGTSRLHVHQAMRKYSDEIVIDTVSGGDEEFCYALENLLRPAQNIGWNSAAGGDVATATRGRIVSEDAKRKIREKATGRVKTQEAKDKFSQAMLGRNLWENSAARKDLWARAHEFYLWFKNNPGKSAKTMAMEFGFSACNPWKLLDKIRSGWIPSEDEAYQMWLSKFREDSYATP